MGEAKDQVTGGGWSADHPGGGGAGGSGGGGAPGAGQSPPLPVMGNPPDSCVRGIAIVSEEPARHRNRCHHGAVGRGRVLVVDDDPALAEMLGIVLRTEGFEPSFVADGDRALAAFRTTKPDLVLLDLMLPGTDGLDVCRQIRSESGTPIVMLTARSDTVDVVLGLECGADDYIVKPFKPKELVARMRARLRSNDSQGAEMLTIGDVSIDVGGHVVSRDGEPIPLTPLEFDLLAALARKPGHVFTREQLLEQVWGYRHAADTRLVNVHVQRLCAKVEHDPERPALVVTVRGVGYKAGPP